jgi:hypothetical protein
MYETKLTEPNGTKYVGPEPNLCEAGTKIIILIYLIFWYLVDDRSYMCDILSAIVKN